MPILYLKPGKFFRLNIDIFCWKFVLIEFKFKYLFEFEYFMFEILFWLCVRVASNRLIDGQAHATQISKKLFFLLLLIPNTGL